MELSSTLCRRQEAFHREQAANATLENARSIAGKAANAWAIEAAAAEKREARRARTRGIAEGMAMPAEAGDEEDEVFAEEDDDEGEESFDEEDRLFSENPDRGFGTG